MLIMDTSYITDTNTNTKIIFGQYFFNLFSKPITKYFLKIPDIFVFKLFNEYPLNNQTLKVILEVIKTSSNNKM